MKKITVVFLLCLIVFGCSEKKDGIFVLNNSSGYLNQIVSEEVDKLGLKFPAHIAISVLDDDEWSMKYGQGRERGFYFEAWKTAVLRQSTLDDWVLRHELKHLIVYQDWGDSLPKLPMSFHEDIACVVFLDNNKFVGKKISLSQFIIKNKTGDGLLVIDTKRSRLPYLYSCVNTKVVFVLETDEPFLVYKDSRQKIILEPRNGKIIFPNEYPKSFFGFLSDYTDVTFSAPNGEKLVITLMYCE